MNVPRPPKPLKIAIASSGLAHIKRGVETWAEDLGNALRAAGADATTFQGSPSPAGPSGTVVPCWKRFDPRTERMVRSLKPLSGWRFGFGNGYEAEQTTFALNLFPRIRRSFDILHVQDPLVARIFDLLHRAGLSRPHVILAHGTEETPETLRKYSNLQHLAPNYLEDWKAHQPPRQRVFAVPNFVDTDRFCPGDKPAMRAACDLPEDALILLSVGALKRGHKRMDYLLEEFRTFLASPAALGYPRVLLLIAGAREADTDEILALAQTLPEGSVRIYENAPRSLVADLMRAADIFTLASLHEMMPIAVLEAMASGLTIACNNTPTLNWIIPPPPPTLSIEKSGALAAQFERLADPELRRISAEAARARAVQVFSTGAVMTQVLAMYEQVAR